MTRSINWKSSFLRFENKRRDTKRHKDKEAVAQVSGSRRQPVSSKTSKRASAALAFGRQSACAAKKFSASTTATVISP